MIKTERLKRFKSLCWQFHIKFNHHDIAMIKCKKTAPNRENYGPRKPGVRNLVDLMQHCIIRKMSIHQYKTVQDEFCHCELSLTNPLALLHCKLIAMRSKQYNVNSKRLLIVLFTVPQQINNRDPIIKQGTVKD